MWRDHNLMTSPSDASSKSAFSHLTPGGAQMVDVGGKAATVRRAIAQGEITFTANVLELIASHQIRKGDVFAVAKIAGIMAAKRAAELIPLCHTLPLTYVDVRFETRPTEKKVIVTAEARTTAQTGVEMEALTATSVALLTIYDMTKSADKKMVISNLRLIRKEGGKSGAIQNQ
jgi:cyclic pyranopterin phosphate synthase